MVCYILLRTEKVIIGLSIAFAFFALVLVYGQKYLIIQPSQRMFHVTFSDF